jgi:hypothetical protein
MRKLLKIGIFNTLIILGLSCSNSQNDINDIWNGEYELTLYYNTDSIYNDLNELLDFTSPDSGFIKYFPSYSANKIHWSLNNNVLSIDSTDFRIVTFTKDSLVLSPYLTENKEPEPDSSENSIATAVPIRDIYYVYKV